MKIETRNLPHKLTTEEIIERSRSLALIESDLREVKVEKKIKIEEFKRREAQLENRRVALGNAVIDGEELRPTNCEWVFDYRHNQKQLVRLDNTEVVATVTLSSYELQTEIPGVEGEAVEIGDKPDDPLADPPIEPKDQPVDELATEDLFVFPDEDPPESEDKPSDHPVDEPVGDDQFDFSNDASPKSEDKPKKSRKPRKLKK